MLSGADLERQLAHVRAAPKSGKIELMVIRPAVGTREVLETGVLDVVEGLVGDCWKDRPNRRTPDNAPDPNLQVTLMSVRSAALLCGPRELWPLAGTQFFVDMNLSMDALPPGTRLAVGGAVLELTGKVNPGCKSFAARFGDEVRKVLTSREGLALNLRGRAARVVQGAQVQTGDWVTSLGRDPV